MTNNQVQLIGRLGDNPTIRETANGKHVRFSLATVQRYRDEEGNKVSETQWHSLTGWGKVAELSEEYLKKGSSVAITGKLTHRDYTDAQGNKRYLTEVQIDELLILE